jgi:hypothetical protein
MLANAPVDENVDKVLQTVLLHSAGEEDDVFQIVLRTDGTGIIYDCSYDETIEIENHTIDLLELASANVVELAEAYDIRFHQYLYRFDIDNDVKIAKKFEDEPTLPRATWNSYILEGIITPLFEAHNDKLSNPVGDGPDDDTEMSLEVGTEDELMATLYGIAYLADQAGLIPEFAFSTGTRSDEEPVKIHECSRDLRPIVEAVLDTFQPTMTTWEYIDENDGRITAYGASGLWFDIAPSEIETYFPSARERLEIKSYLTEIFTKYGIEVGLIEATFNPLSD